MHWIVSTLCIPLSSLLIIKTGLSGACFALGTGCSGPGCLPQYPAYCAYRYCGAAASAAAAKRALGAKTIVANDRVNAGEEFRSVATGQGIGSTASGVEKSVPDTPDEMFGQCCEAWSLPSQCRSKCNYQNYTAEALRAMFVRSDECPIEAASIIHFCSSQNRDHSLCCERNGISMTSAGPKCMLFCEPMPKNETSLNFSYLPCLEKFAQIKECFFENALREVDYLEMETEQGAGRRFQKEGVAPENGNPNGGRSRNAEKPSFVITRAPIVFVNSLDSNEARTPRINDDYGDA